MWVMFGLLAWIAALTSCARLSRAAFAAGRWPDPYPDAGPPGELTLPQTAFLAGGPRRVTDLVLVRMARARRLLLAHTGWVTVVDPEPHDALERGVLAAIGSYGQARIADVHAAAAGSEPMTALGEDLARTGLAVPPEVRAAVTAGVRSVRKAGAAVLSLWLAATALAPPHVPAPAVGGWFVLPLLLVAGSLLISRLEIRHHTDWASYAGQQALARLAVPRQRTAGAVTDEHALLTALAVRGPAALPEPALRQALLGAGRRERAPQARLGE
ncbi:TIGR04222 domain-containing membrane protein [Streptomyces smaragdinus]